MTSNADMTSNASSYLKCFLTCAGGKKVVVTQVSDA
uniref:Uncharacterized protein n=1 Tax=Arundo donax TaxID=35708 RepID=A0A0A9HJ81_ARUDO